MYESLFTIYFKIASHVEALVIALPLAAIFYVTLRASRQWRIAIFALASLAMLVATALFVADSASSTSDPWCAMRLTQSLSWRMGYRLYYPPGQGPMLVRMYGPVSAMVYLPAVFASRPTSAMLIGATINFLLVATPACWMIFRGGTRSISRVAAIVGLALFAIWAERCDVLIYCITRVTIDGPAIGFSACACTVLMLRSAKLHPIRSGLLCGLFVALAAWTKQTAAPIALAVVIYSLAIYGWRWTLRFFATFTSVGIAFSILMIAGFGFRELYFNLFEIPARQPWQSNFGASEWQAVRHAMFLVINDCSPILIPAAVLSAILVWRRILSRDSLGWLMPAIAAVCVWPTSAVAYAKVGGYPNNSIAVAYFVLLAAACAARDLLSLISWNRLACSSVALLLIAATIAQPARWRNYFARVAQWNSISQNQQEFVFDYMQTNRDAYFPFHPLPMMLVTHRAYHTAAALRDLDWAGIKISEPQLSDYLPPMCSN